MMNVPIGPFLLITSYSPRSWSRYLLQTWFFKAPRKEITVPYYRSWKLVSLHCSNDLKWISPAELLDQPHHQPLDRRAKKCDAAAAVWWSSDTFSFGMMIMIDPIDLGLNCYIEIGIQASVFWKREAKPIESLNSCLGLLKTFDDEGELDIPVFKRPPQPPPRREISTTSNSKMNMHSGEEAAKGKTSWEET